MQFSTSYFVLGLASIAAAVSTTSYNSSAEYDPFEGKSPDMIAPINCHSAAAVAYASCIKPVTSYWNCYDDGCYCNSARIDQSCGVEHCYSTYFNSDLTDYCSGTSSIVEVKTTAHSSEPSSAAAKSTSSAFSASSASSSSSAGSASAANTASTSPSATGTPNAVARPVVAGGLLALAAAAAGVLVN